MKPPKYELPSMTFPYKITRRLNLLSIPRKYFVSSNEGMPALSPTGVRKSALNSHISDRVNDAAWPYIRRLILLKRMYKHFFSAERLQRVDQMIDACNATMYSKLANCQINIKSKEIKEKTKKKGWNESEWKKHTDYLVNISKPKPDFKPEPIERGPHKPLEELKPRAERLAIMPSFKIYKRLSQDDWYKDPKKVSPMAMKYKISDRVKKLAEHRVYTET